MPGGCVARPFVFTNLGADKGVAAVAEFITTMGGLAPRPPDPASGPTSAFQAYFGSQTPVIWSRV
jgi:hypothetical protein